MRFTLATASALLLSSGAFAHDDFHAKRHGHGHDHAAKRFNEKRQSPPRGNVVENAAIKDPVQECSPYWFPPFDQHAKNFPPTWGVASIVKGDTAAQNKFAEIKSKILPIKPKVQGQSYPGDDPDCWWTATTCVTPKHAGIPADVARIPEPLSIGYGFDDGPNCSHNAFYDFLQEKNQKATMFFIGSNVVNWPYEAQRALYDGHEMCVHSWSHNAMTQLTDEQAFAEVWYTLQAIKVITGVTPTCFRPPYGDTDDRIRSIVSALGMSTILWQYDSDDWVGGPEVDTNYNTFINKGKSGEFNTQGTIYLQHEIDEFTMGKAMQYHPAMSSAFKHLVPVAVALNKTSPYAEKDVLFPTFDEYVSGTVQKPLPASVYSFLGVPSPTATTTPSTTPSSTSTTTTPSSPPTACPAQSEKKHKRI